MPIDAVIGEDMRLPAWFDKINRCVLRHLLASQVSYQRQGLGQWLTGSSGMEGKGFEELWCILANMRIVIIKQVKVIKVGGPGQGARFLDRRHEGLPGQHRLQGLVGICYLLFRLD